MGLIENVWGSAQGKEVILKQFNFVPSILLDLLWSL